jgi:hypothetical protein
VITLFDALHSAAGTFHSLAAAWISMVRAVAPALRTYSCDSRMARLPAVNCLPHVTVSSEPGKGSVFMVRLPGDADS